MTNASPGGAWMASDVFLALLIAKKAILTLTWSKLTYLYLTTGANDTREHDGEQLEVGLDDNRCHQFTSKLPP